MMKKLLVIYLTLLSFSVAAKTHLILAVNKNSVIDTAAADILYVIEKQFAYKVSFLIKKSNLTKAKLKSKLKKARVSYLKRSMYEILNGDIYTAEEIKKWDSSQQKGSIAIGNGDFSSNELTFYSISEKPFFLKVFSMIKNVVAENDVRFADIVNNPINQKLEKDHVEYFLRSLYQKKETYAQLLLHNRRAEMSKALGRRCTKTLKKFYKNGNKLESQQMKRHLMPLYKFAKKYKHIGSNFYHHTNWQGFLKRYKIKMRDRQEAHALMIKKKRYNIHLAKGKYNSYKEDSGREITILPTENAFFVAYDKTSSSHYGKIQIKFKLNPHAVIVDSEPTINWSPIANEIISDYPEIYSDCQFDLLKGFIKEDSGADMIDYHSDKYVVKNGQKYYPKRPFWFKILNSNIIQMSSIKNSGKEKKKKKRRGH